MEKEKKSILSGKKQTDFTEGKRTYSGWILGTAAVEGGKFIIDESVLGEIDLLLPKPYSVFPGILSTLRIYTKTDYELLQRSMNHIEARGTDTMKRFLSANVSGIDSVQELPELFVKLQAEGRIFADKRKYYLIYVENGEGRVHIMDCETFDLEACHG